MDNQLKTLISLYEEEKVRLEKLINECLTDEEYLLAHYHSNALHQLNGRRRTLQNIDDNLYDEKEFELRRISILEKQMEGTNSNHMKKYFSKELLKAKDALELLKQTSPKTANGETYSLFENVLIRLLDMKVKNVKLILKKADNFFFAFTYSNRTMKVTLPYINQHIKKWTLHDENIEAFKKLGFNMAENGSKLILTIIGNKQEILSKLKLILSKIVFEIFYYKEFENESYIKYTDKPSH